MIRWILSDQPISRVALAAGRDLQVGGRGRQRSLHRSAAAAERQENRAQEARRQAWACCNALFPPAGREEFSGHAVLCTIAARVAAKARAFWRSVACRTRSRIRWRRRCGEELKKATGGDEVVPVLQVGRRALRGFEEGQWNAALDNAGYPKTRTGAGHAGTDQTGPVRTTARAGSRHRSPMTREVRQSLNRTRIRAELTTREARRLECQFAEGSPAASARLARA